MRWLIYPYSPEFIPVLRSKELMTENQITCLAAPSGFALEGKDGYIWGTDKSEYKILTTVDPQMYDGIWITPEIAYMQEAEMFTAIDALHVSNKTIYFSGILPIATEELLLKTIKDKGAAKIIHRKTMYDNFEWIIGNKLMYKLDTPIIAIAGIGTSVQKFDAQLYLRRHLLKMGYTVSQIGTKPYCEMLGFHSMPEWMFDKTYTDVEKVYAFNHYLKYIELKEKPEVIVLGIPEGIMAFNDKHSQGFGIKAFEILSAIHPDYLLVSLYNGEYSQEFFEEIRKLSRYRFHIDVDDFFISNYVPVSNSYKREQLQFTFSMENAHTQGVFSFVDLLNSKMVDKIVEKLSVYDEYEVI